MSSSAVVADHHLNRRAVIYIRQSTGHQVLSNVESRKMQLAMADHAKRLGWTDERITVVEADTGRSAQSTAGRQGYKALLSEIALGEVGIVLSYESTRLSRNCSDWYPLLDVCAFAGCLIADRDGTYDPSTANGRLLLGMKGIVSEIELHTLRGRLVAGAQNKARRGELALVLPAGLIRLENGRVVKDPDIQVQEAIGLVFRTFSEVRSASKVLRHLRAHGLRLPKRRSNQETVWRRATAAGIVSLLRNPAYAGAYVYGKTQVVRKPGMVRPQQRRRPMSQWRVIVKDQYPAYVSWETFEEIQKTLTDNYAEYDRNKSRGVPRDGDALLQGIAWCAECGHKMVVQYKGGARYLCNYHRQQHQSPVCQYLPAEPVDEHVVKAFFEALSPAELDLYERAMQSRRESSAAIEAAQERELQRLRYETELARRQYDRVDPDNRLVASELERRWEVALRALRDAEERFEKERRDRDNVIPLRVPNEMREAFASVGQSLPAIWKQDKLTRSQRKALLRCLIERVAIRRREQRDRVHVRVVWRGGAVSEADISIPVGTLSDLSNAAELERLILEQEAAGKSDDEIATCLTEQGFRSPKSNRLLASTVRTIRLRHGRIHRFKGPRPRNVEGFLTLPQVADKIGVTPHRLYHLIRRGLLDIERDPETRLYLFPDKQDVIRQVCRLCDDTIPRLSIRREHQDG